LTMTFTENLDGDSVPAPGAFRVTVNGSRRSIASGGVAVSGQTVTLTLASGVAHGDTVKVRYTRPSRNPLQGDAGVAGVAVSTFADQDVTNNTPAGIIWSATLNARNLSGPFGCWTGVYGESNDCSSALSDHSFTHAGTDYQLEAVIEAATTDNVKVLFVQLDREFPNDLTLHVDGRRFPLADGTYSDSNKRVTWTNPGVVWSQDQQVLLRLTAPQSGGSGLIGSDEDQVPAATVSRVAVSSSPQANDTYALGETIRITLSFTQLVVDVDTTGGTPRLKIDMDPAEWGEKWATYESGSGTHSLTFSHTVVEPNISTQGIAVLENSLELNGGTIQSDGEDAGLAHTGLAHDPSHKVDWQTQPENGGGGNSGQSGNDQQQVSPASVSRVAVSSSPQANATYALGETIRITLTFTELQVDVDTSGGTPRLKIDMDPAEWGEKWASYESGSGTHSLTFAHTVVEPNISTQGIAVLANTLELNGSTIQSDGADADADLAHTGLAHDAEHKVDWQQSPPAANSPATGAPAITGTARVGETLTADTSGIADADGLDDASFSYQWLADGADISGATGSSYTLAGADRGKAVRVRVSFTDDAGNSETLTSAATAAVAAKPPEVDRRYSNFGPRG
ncbi:MAG: SwmB domain-containing protein, partial [bacterium]|nr:SwmB domain-containing protein [bacterium]